MDFGALPEEKTVMAEQRRGRLALHPIDPPPLEIMSYKKHGARFNALRARRD